MSPRRGGVDIAQFFLALAAILVAAKLLGELAERIGQPAVLGELVAGVLLGGQRAGRGARRRARGRADPRPGRARGAAAAVRDRARDRPARDVPGRARVARRGRGGRRRAVRPRLRLLGATCPIRPAGARRPRPPPPSSSAPPSPPPRSGSPRGCSPISAAWRTAEARIIIGAAVIDDVLGLVILSVVSGVAAGRRGLGARACCGRSRSRSGFLVVAVLVGPLPGAAPVRRGGADAGALRAPGVRGRVRAGPRRRWPPWPGPRSSSARSRPAHPVGHQPVRHHRARGPPGRRRSSRPIFFVSVGASVDLRLLDPTSPTARGTLGVAAALTAIADRRQDRRRLGRALAAHAPARRRRRHGAPRRGRAHLRRHRPPVGRAVGRGVRRRAADGHGDHLRRPARRSRPSSAAAAAEPAA